MSEEEKDVKNEETTEESSTTEALEVETQSTEVDEEETDEVKNAALHTRLNELADDNKRQKALLDQLMLLGMSGGQSGVVQQVQEDDSEIDPAIAKKLKTMEQRQNQQFQGMLGGVFEEMDRTAILTSSKAKLYTKYEQEVEAFRQRASSQGRFFKREEALANILLGKGLLGESASPKPKKVVKQNIAPGGETQKATTPSTKEVKPVSLRDKLAGQKF